MLQLNEFSEPLQVPFLKSHLTSSILCIVSNQNILNLSLCLCSLYLDLILQLSLIQLTHEWLSEYIFLLTCIIIVQILYNDVLFKGLRDELI